MGKKSLEAAKLVDRDRMYTVEEAAELVKKAAFANFDESVEIHARLGIDPRQADQAIRSSVVLPHGSGRTVRVLVFASGEAERIALEAGADYAGSDELVQKINGGWLEFDATIAMADQMGKVGGLGRVLGRRGLMPNPRSGTVVREVSDLPNVIRELKGGRVEFRNDRTGNLHLTIGRKSFDEKQIVENVLAVVDAINRVKPTGLKGVYCRTLAIATTMGPGIHLDVNDTFAKAASAN
ncbi:MAG: 50S ribosomal protein L1 [Thermomicrobiales bacterium]|nr:50S ribosomal protein L1 [Thermomicrobiales bacterium]MCO5217836.1 50S ribosomal protein L1 [Thermomicrobiales bacterium]MCO5223906.1 50S ribosomal protein L1 [Thermomicrobiales bacterium]MCO5227469.1 50S ribosomal protein L1 [Thermomicrobiales bacterium]